MTSVLYPGSFDPIHNGHLEIIEVASTLFDEVVVAAMRNPQKGEPMFDLEERKEILVESVAHLDNVRITQFSTPGRRPRQGGRRRLHHQGPARRVRLRVEMHLAHMNHAISGVHTLFIPSSSTHSFVASKLIREIARFGGDVSSMVPAPGREAGREKYPT